MDPQTISFYEVQAASVAARYEAVGSPVERYFSMAFPPGARVLDVGCGSGRDAARLLDCGFDAFGIEPSAGLRSAAVAAHPGLVGRIAQGALPDTGEAFGGDFDGVLCSAVLMHVPDTELLDAALALRKLLKPNGRLLLSLPASRGEVLVADRDNNGRLFSPYTAEAITLLFERLGFQSIGRWQTGDHLGRAATSWYTLLLELRHVGAQRPIDQIETILNRDRKEATYKLALFRALATMAMQEARSAVWFANGDVGIPMQRIAELWLLYYWPIFASVRFIPQSKAEAAGGKPVKFRAGLSKLIEQFESQGVHGGLTAWHLAQQSGRLDPQLVAQLKEVLRSIAETIRDGPVTYSGGALASGPVFRYDRRLRLVLMPAELWREFSLLGHWIGDAVIVRWAALTQQFSHRQGISSGDVLPLLLAAPESSRATAVAREVFQEQGVSACTWSGKRLRADFVVDHAIPFSLWGNNDLWNLVPADPKVNLSKSDKLPASELLRMRRPAILQTWEMLRECVPATFDRHAAHLLGGDLLCAEGWQATLFARYREAIELTALQRGVQRWTIVD